MKDKSRYIEDLRKVIEEGEVDLRIIDTLNILNSKGNYYTTSSCAGRIILIELEEIGGKKESNFIYKSHEKVDYKDIWRIINEYSGDKMLFLIVNSPIIHVVCRDIGSAKKLIGISKDSGFKYSSIFSIEGKIIVEIRSTEKMDVPVVKDCKVYPSEEYIMMLVGIGNQLIDRIKNKIERLNNNLRSIE
jgi:tRNA wybutosine-synthesizing protein 3